jgi:hypothetical protein
MDCTFQSAVGRKGLPSSRWDRSYAIKNINTVKGK